MKKNKQKLPSSKDRKKNIIYIIIPIIIILIVIGIFVRLNSKKEYQSLNEYHKGDLFSANQAANFIDEIDNQANILISPININSTLAILYNGTDNNTNKELKKYFKETSSSINNEMTNKLSDFTKEEKKSTKYTKLYEEYIDTLIEKNYDNLNYSKIKLLSSEEKKSLQELIEKIDLIYSCIYGNNNLTIEYIEKYKVDDNLITNEYTLQSMLNSVLDKYETYKITNEVSDYHEIFVKNNISKNKINDSYNENTKTYNLYISHIDLSNPIEASEYINNRIKEKTQNNINRVVEQDEITNENIMINSLYFNYEWENSITANNVKNEEFEELDGNISQVEIMYSKETTYYENSHARAFKKDFQNKKYSYIGILPNQVGDFSLSSLDIDDLLLNEKEENVIVGLPKYTITTEVLLKNILKNQSIKEIFNKEANFTKITDEEFSITQNIQKVYLKIGEKGTIDSNINNTSIESFTEEGNEKKIILNRPFCFLIINNETNDVLFIGKITSFNNQ